MSNWKQDFRERYMELARSKKMNSWEQVSTFFQMEFEALIDGIPYKDFIEVKKTDKVLTLTVGNTFVDWR
ncbi:hypothetical protein UM89_14590 [Bacillus subtilis]|nr:hypothetical protein UM89_14590 [Bacillus subtilis]